MGVQYGGGEIQVVSSQLEIEAALCFVIIKQTGRIFFASAIVFDFFMSFFRWKNVRFDWDLDFAHLFGLTGFSYYRSGLRLLLTTF